MQLFVEPGTLLAAWPDLMDPNFMHSVLLMCQHSAEGAYGLVINRPLEIGIGELLPEHPALAGSEFPVHLGGPVDHSCLQFVHRAPADIKGGMELGAGLYLGGELDDLGAYLKSEGKAAEAKVRVMLGYSGWGEGQLDQELSKGSWLPASIQSDVIFAEDGRSVWRQVVRSIGPEGANLEHQPPDVSWN